MAVKYGRFVNAGIIQHPMKMRGQVIGLKMFGAALLTINVKMQLPIHGMTLLKFLSLLPGIHSPETNFLTLHPNR